MLIRDSVTVNVPLEHIVWFGFILNSYALKPFQNVKLSTEQLATIDLLFKTNKTPALQIETMMLI